MPKSSARDRDKTSAALRILFEANWNGADIGRAFGYSTRTIMVWRREAGIELVRASVDDAEGRRLYALGYSDGRIGRELGVAQYVVTRWRNSAGLCPNFVPSSLQISQADRRKAMQLIRWGASKDKIASLLGMNRNTVQNIRKKVRDGAPRSAGRSDASLRKEATSDGKLARRIEAAIGLGVPAHIRADAVSDLLVDVLDGIVSPQMIEQAAPTYRSRAYDMCGSNYGARSLAEEIGEDWTLGDTLADPDALEQMEWAAEQAYENDNW